MKRRSSERATSGRATLIYDGKCHFCRRWVERVRRWDARCRLDFVTYQTPDLEARFPGVSRDECRHAMHLVDEDGAVYRGAAAGREVLARLPRGRLWALPFRLPGALAIAEPVYGWITRRWGPVPRERQTPRRRLGARIGRTAVAARLTSRAARRWVASRMREVGRDETERARLRTAFHLRTAEDVTAAMGAMKGAMMKLAQMVSYVDAGVPEPYRETLARLQADAPPMTYALAADVVREELGGPPEDVFERFDPEPLAAASIGQVHAARTRMTAPTWWSRCSTPVPRRPCRRTSTTSTSSTGCSRWCSRDSTRSRSSRRSAHASARSSTTGSSADNQERFLALYRGHPFIRVPAVVPALSTRRVLTMERMTGLAWRDAVAAPLDVRQVWAEAIYRYVFGTFYRHGLFNGDPHPGNYLFQADGSVAFLDYGCLKEFTPAGLADVRRIVLLSIGGDATALRAELVRQGFLSPDDDADPGRILAWLQIGYRPILGREPFAITRAWAELSARATVDPTSEWTDVQRRFDLPADYVLLQRIGLGLMSVLASLGATNTWRAICEEFWHDAPPATTLGRADAAFRARRSSTEATA